MTDNRPSCSGHWISGSGGHRKHEPCSKPADWWHPDDMYAYCELHLSVHDGFRYIRWPELRERLEEE